MTKVLTDYRQKSLLCDNLLHVYLLHQIHLSYCKVNTYHPDHQNLAVILGTICYSKETLQHLVLAR